MDEEHREYDGPDRRKHPSLSDEQIEHIAQRAADLAVKKVTDQAYAAVGKSLVEKAMWVIGVCAMALFFWLAQKGIIKQ